MNERPINVLVCALGGEGGGVLAEWLVELARVCGHSAQGTSIPGVAQRTGATTYYLEFFPRPDSELGGRRPVFSLNPVPGTLDLLVSSELLETVRQIGNGMTHPARTQVLSSTHRMLTTAEKMVPGDGRRDAGALLQVVQAHARDVQVFDMAAAAQRAGTAISAVLFGAIAASGALPFPRAAYEEVIRRAGLGVDASLRGFALAFEQIASARPAQVALQAALTGTATAGSMASSPAAAAHALPEPLAREFPAAAHDYIAAALARLRDYQDEAYAELYLQRLRRIAQAEQAADAAGAHGHAATREAARYLALWMAFDDIVRVADLKSRASRIARVRAEVKAGDDELLKVYEHFKPGVPEFAALLPARLGDALQRWEQRRLARGKVALSLPLKIGTHGITGLLALRLLASCKGLRRRGSRFAAEQAMIERWLAAIEAGLRQDAALGREIAACGRLIKGYGSTNERGKENLLHVLDHLAAAAPFDTPHLRADAIRAAREAALADDAGKALDATLLQHGAPARPIKPQPIRWVRHRPGLASRNGAAR